jgi:hypothetical protein
MSEASEIAWDTLPNIHSEVEHPGSFGKVQKQICQHTTRYRSEVGHDQSAGSSSFPFSSFRITENRQGQSDKGPTRRVGRPNWRKQRCVTLRIGSSRSTVQQNDPAGHQLPPTGSRPTPLTAAAMLRCGGCQGRRHDPWRRLRPSPRRQGR